MRFYSEACRRACPYAVALLETPVPQHRVPGLEEARSFAELEIARWSQAAWPQPITRTHERTS